MPLLKDILGRWRRHGRRGLESLGSGFAALYIHAPLGIAVIGPDGRFLSANRALTDMLGYAERELRDRTIDDVTHPDDVAGCRDAFERARRERESFQREKRFIRKDGGLVWARVIVTAVRERRGPEPVVICACVDVSQEKRLGEEHRALYARTPALLHSIDGEGRLLAVSDRWLEALGYAREDVIGRSVLELLTPDSRAAADLRLARAGSITDVPCRFMKKGGESVDVLLSATCERDEAGRLLRSLCVLVDVTARKHAEEEVRRLAAELERLLREKSAELERSNADLEMYAYAASHNLSAPLRKIAVLGALLERRAAAKLDEEERRTLGRMRGAAEDMALLIKEILGLALIGREPRPPEEVDLGEVMAEVLADLGGPIRRCGALVSVGALPRVRGHRGLLYRLLANLVENSLKFRRKDERLRVVVESRPAEGGVELVVRDNGIGFEPRFARKIFEPFSRLHVPGVYAGYGIGLAACRRVAERYGGRIGATGVPGHGARFVVWLPQSMLAR